MNNVTRRLIAKDFYLHRWMIGGSLVAGLLGLAIAAEGGVMRFNVGFLIWVTTIIAFGEILAMFGVSNERKDRTLLFVLSLPLSHGDYVRTKLLGLVLCFLAPWLILSGSAIGLILAMPDMPDGLLPICVLMCGFLLAGFSIVLCGVLHVKSEGGTAALIIVINTGVTLFIFGVGGIASIRDYLQSPTAHWTFAFWCVLAVEFATLLLALSAPYFVAARRRDFI